MAKEQKIALMNACQVVTAIQRACLDIQRNAYTWEETDIRNQVGALAALSDMEEAHKRLGKLIAHVRKLDEG